MCGKHIYSIKENMKIQHMRFFTGDSCIEKKYWISIYECIDLAEILDIQNSVNRENGVEFIWGLCTCVFIIPKYSSSLIDE